jgi:transposase
MESLSEDEIAQVSVMLSVDVSLSTAYFLKEQFFKILKCNSSSEAKNMLSNWVTDAQKSGIKRFSDCANTMSRWSVGILNSFDYPYTNGFTEGVNNKIKVLKRNAYGYRNFNRFRNRIFHIFAYKNKNISNVA